MAQLPIPPLTTLDPTTLGVIAAAVGAVVVKIAEKWLGRRSESALEAERVRAELRAENLDSTSEAERLRAELRVENTLLRSDNIRLRKDADEWREKYWHAFDNHIEHDE